MAKLPHQIAIESERRRTRLARRGPVRSAGVGSSVPLGDPVLTPQQAVEAEQKRTQEPPAPNPALPPQPDAPNPPEQTQAPLGPVAAAAEAQEQPQAEPKPAAFPFPPEPQQQ